MSRTKTKVKKCIFCGADFLPWSNSAKYCSSKCMGDEHKLATWEKWKAGIAPISDTTKRRILLEFMPHQCQSCNASHWMGKPIPLEMHHKDGDYKNNKLQNILLICPNCHALTPTYKAKNKGHGRRDR